MATTQQEQSKKGNNPNGIGGFGDNPGNRNPGGWKKENSFSYQYRRFMNMSLNELNEWRALGDMEKKVVEELAYKAVMRAKDSLPDVKEITDRTEGKAKESISLDANVEMNIGTPSAQLASDFVTYLKGKK